MKAELLYRHRQDFDDGAIVEAVIWKLPMPIKASSHPYKYRLFYGFSGKCIVGYDNERGKETVYRFVSPEKLLDDFIADIEAERALK